MQPIIVTAYDGYNLTGTNGLKAYVRDQGGDISASPNYRSVGGSVPVFVGGEMETKSFTVVVEFDQITSQATRLAKRQEICGLFFDETQLEREHKLEAILDDGTTEVYRMVSPTSRPAISETYVTIELMSGKIGWYAVTEHDTGETLYGVNGQQILQNFGKIAAFPIYRVYWRGSQRTAGTDDFGARYSRIFRITNNSTHTAKHESFMIDLGDTKTIVNAGKSLASGNDLRVYDMAGRELRRQTVNYDTKHTHLWITVAKINPGDYYDVEVVYGNLDAGDPPLLGGTSDDPAFDLPAFAIYGLHGISDTGRAIGTNTLTDSTLRPMWTDEFRGGRIEIVEGPGTGELHGIASNTSDTFTITGSWGLALTGSSKYNVWMSTNTRHVYKTDVRSRGAVNTDGNYLDFRGGWYLNQSQHKPTIVKFADQIPGAWSRFLYQDNRDRKQQIRYSYLFVGGSDYDPFAIFDTTRAKGEGRTGTEDGQYDGVFLNNFLGIENIRCDYKLQNPFQMCMLKILAMDEGGEALTDVFTTNTSSLGLVSYAVADYDLTDFGNPIQIAFVLVGLDENHIEGEIPPKINKKYTANARWGDVLEITVNTNLLDIDEIQTETEKYQLGVILRKNGGNNDIHRTPYGLLEIGQAGHRLMVEDGQYVSYDTRKASLKLNNDDGTLARAIPNCATFLKAVSDRTGVTRKRVDRLAMTMRAPVEKIYNGLFTTNLDGWQECDHYAGSTGVASWSSGALNLQVTTNTAPAGHAIVTLYNAGGRIGVVAGDVVDFVARIKTNNLDIAPSLGVLFTNGDGSLTEAKVRFFDAMPDTSFHYRQVADEAPVWAKYAYAALMAVTILPGELGIVSFDNVTTAKEMLFVTESHMGAVTVEVQHEPGFIE